MDEPQKDFRVDLDALADYHVRLDKCETYQVMLSRRITALEAGAVHRHNDDELFDNKTMGMLFLLMVIPIVLPMIGDMVTKWRSQS